MANSTVTRIRKPAPGRRHVVDREHLRREHIFVDGDDEQSKIAISAYKTLRTNMLRAMQARETRGLLVTSPTKGAGKSVTAANLAINIARHQDREVLLVDLDLRSPSLAQLFGLKVASGVEHAGRGGFDLKSAIVETDIPRLSLLPCAAPHQNSSELLLDRPLSSLIRSLQRDNTGYTVVFDAPPVLGCDDVPAIAPIVDLALMVVGEAQTSRKELVRALGDIQGIDIAGVLLNKSRKKFFQQYYYG